MAARLNEAYGVLGDRGKRAFYDAQIADEVRSAEGDPAAGGEVEEEAVAVACDRCGVRNAGLRRTRLNDVRSTVVATYLRKVEGVWCEPCRR